MGTLLLIFNILGIINRLLPIAEKLYKGKGKGKAKRKYVLKKLGEEWGNQVESGIITGDLAKVPMALLLTTAGNLIDGVISVANRVEGGP